MAKVPHLVQYQGSKRNLAPEIIRYFPDKINRIIEPFAGTCAVTILSAYEKKGDKFIVNDINQPLIELMRECVNNPERLYQSYKKIWERQFLNGEDNNTYFYKVREQFNAGDHEPAKMLFLLARVVKGAIRYNSQGMMNQSCDKRRFGTKPDIIFKNAIGISELLKGKIEFYSLDYKEIFEIAKPGDLVYLDPPYQGTSNRKNPRDNRYIQGVDFDEFVDSLYKLSCKGVNYIVSYDGKTGDKSIGKLLPDELGLTHLYINAGPSAQATLNGKNEITYESLYVSKGLVRKSDVYQQLCFKFA